MPRELDSVDAMDMVRHVVVFDASDVDAESRFWAGMFGGQVFGDDAFHCVIDSEGAWHVGVQLASGHVPPEWPDGRPQQVHLDLHVDDPRAAHDVAAGLGATLLQPGDLDADEGHQVYADPAGHPFCIGWGHPSRDAVAAFVAERARGQPRETRSRARLVPRPGDGCPRRFGVVTGGVGAGKWPLSVTSAR